MLTLKEVAPTQAKTGRTLDIALVHASDEGGGAERSVLTLHQTLRRLGHRSRLFVGWKQTNEPDVFEIRRDRSIPGLLRLTRWMENGLGVQNLYAPWFRNLFQQIGSADVLHVHTLWGGTYGYSDLSGLNRLARRYPLVLTLRDGWMLTGHCACPIQCDRWKSGCGKCPDLKRVPAVPRDFTALNWRRKQSAVQRSSLHVTAVSSWLKEQIERSPIFAGKPVSVVHNSIDESVFVPGSRQQARAELGLPPNEFLILMAGQTIEGIQQGIAQQGVQALNRLGHSEIVPFLIGHSANRVAATLLGKSIARPFQSAPEQMALCYQAADLTLVCSEYETFGRVAAESLCCGTPVVAFSTGGLTDIVIPDVTGWLVPTGDVDGLVNAIRTAYERRELLAEFGLKASRMAARSFATERVAGEFLDVYGRAIHAATAVGHGT